MRSFESLGEYKSKFLVVVFWSTIIGFMLGFLRGVVYVGANRYLDHEMHYLTLYSISSIISHYLLISLGVGAFVLVLLRATQTLLESVSTDVRLNKLITIGVIPSLLMFVIGGYWLNRVYLPDLISMRSIIGSTIWLLTCVIIGWLILKASQMKFLTSPGRYKLKMFVILILLVAGLNAGSQLYLSSLDSGRPNLILISIDTLRPDHLSCYGYYRNTSPNIDRLARDGVMFRNTVAQSSWTLPSHMSMLTGLYSSSHGVVLSEIRLNDEHLTLAEVLQNSGYNTVAFTDGGYLSDKYGYQGFNLFDGSRTACSEYDCIKATYRKSVEWLRKNHKGPFFLFLHTYQVHAPFDPPSEYDIYSDKNYSGVVEVSGNNNDYYKKIKSQMSNQDYLYVIDKYDGGLYYTDQFLGKLFEELKRLGLYEKSIIMVTSDHGEHFLERKDSPIGHIGHVEHKLYDEIVKVPLIIKAAQFPKDRIIDAQVESIDIMPTVLELLEIPIPSGLDGESLVSLVNINKGSQLGKNYAFSEKFSPPSKNREGEYSMIRSNDWKLLLSSSGNESKTEIELYDLRADSKEQNNLFAQEVEIGKSLFGELQAWMDIQKRKSRFAPTDKIELDENLKEQLKALGYMN